ncbi:thioredoxin family protein [Desulfosporosinus sp. PR]|uniref:thioredoxin family protein n=1 Tax=Candidatus Desulfosporosinus nitrosoreducens TaxID=3401928 RepID=UPI0027E9284B|nr:thioredoxin family protein [Desulfosporosinus sp. PR]MDQ7094579.1 thioredoxin family protein [Desulfosporosinus sp. PR]
MSLQPLDSSRFEEVIYNNGEPCLVIFSRESCHVCQGVLPILEDLQPQFAGKFSFYHVDVEEEKALYQKFSLKGVPQILFFKDGEYQGKLAGKVEEEDVEERITDVLSES